jgi:hypothetical protein
MKPVTHHLKPFALERVPSIRLNRELILAEGREEGLGKGHKKTKKRRSSGKSTRKGPKVTLDAKAQKQLETLDPATQAFLKKAMGT